MKATQVLLKSVGNAVRKDDLGTKSCLNEIVRYAAGKLSPKQNSALNSLLPDAESHIDDSPHPILASVEDLAFLHEKVTSHADSKKRGVFYTPLLVTRRLVNEVLRESASRSKLISILDPACGSGIFLIEALRILVADFQYSVVDAIMSLHGVDIDSRAVDVTRALLFITACELGGPISVLEVLQTQIVCGNALLDPEEIGTIGIESHNALSWRNTFSDATYVGGFDVIVGNPPYGLSRGKQLSPTENKLLKAAYQELRDGKVNKYILFLARGYSLLNQKGILAFIVPNAWLGIRGGRKLRERLLLDGAIDEIVYYQTPVFPDPSVEAVTIKLKRSGKSEEIRIYLEDSVSETLKSTPSLVKRSRCLENQDSVIPLYWSDEIEELITQIKRVSSPLSSKNFPIEPSIALQAYSFGKGTPAQSHSVVKEHPFHSERKINSSYIPYLQGADVRRFSIEWSGEYLSYGPWLAEPQRIERFTGPRVLIREILGTSPNLFIAAYTEDSYLYNKSILHVLPTKEESQDILRSLCAILNSTVGSFLVKCRGRKSQRKLFPKIVNDDLKDLLLPNNLKDFASELALYVRRIEVHPREDLLKELENKILEIYGLKEDDRDRMVQLINRFA